jgi:hypothetical protein
VRETLEHLRAFELWYACDRSLTLTAEKLGRASGVIYQWKRELNWDARADARDRQVAQQVGNAAIRKRVELLKRHLELGDKLLRAGAEYLDTWTIDSAKDAIKAIEVGAKLQLQAAAVPHWFEQVVNASDEELQLEYQDLLQTLHSRSDAAEEGFGAGDGEEGDNADDRGSTLGSGLLQLPAAPSTVRAEHPESPAVVEATGDSERDSGPQQSFRPVLP